MSSFSKSFTATGSGTAISVPHNSFYAYSLSGTFVGTLILERSLDAGSTWDTIVTKTAAASDTLLADHPDKDSALYRWRCSAYTSGTAVAVVTENPTRTRDLLIPAAVCSKVGAGAGFVVGAASNIALATVPASQTASTLVTPVQGLNVGDTITAFHAIGQIESAGGAVTVDVELRKQTSAAADVTDASVASMTQISVVADTAVKKSAYEKVGLGEVVVAGDNYYFLTTVTTAASTDVGIQAFGITVKPVTV
jgi:hypothetical protein